MKAFGRWMTQSPGRFTVVAACLATVAVTVGGAVAVARVQGMAATVQGWSVQAEQAEAGVDPETGLRADEALPTPVDDPFLTPHVTATPGGPVPSTTGDPASGATEAATAAPGPPSASAAAVSEPEAAAQRVVARWGAGADLSGLVTPALADQLAEAPAAPGTAVVGATTLLDLDGSTAVVAVPTTTGNLTVTLTLDGNGFWVAESVTA